MWLLQDLCKNCLMLRWRLLNGCNDTKKGMVISVLSLLFFCVTGDKATKNENE